jgi:para-aminobenzoate synthetase component 1
VHIPDLSSLCESESHVVLLFDQSPNRSCLLGIGVKRELLFKKSEPGILDALEKFSKEGNAWTFGWFGYDLKNEIENLETRNPDTLGHPVLAWWEPEIVIQFSDSSVDVLSGDINDPRTQEALHAINQKGEVEETGGMGEMVWSWDKSKYLQAFDEVKHLIQNGDVYELNLCMPLKGKASSNASWPLFCRLQSLTQAPFSGYLQCRSARIMSGSPERFLKREGDRLMSQPIKGTVRRGRTTEEDNALIDALQSSEKERAENVMIVDLVRNDLSRIAQKASVEVTELCGIHSFQTVHQMVSTIECKLRKDKGLSDILRATFPMGSMTGAPKISAMKHIDRLELEGRGSYSGSIGYITPTGDFDFNVLIRSLFHNSETEALVANVGGAITALSDPHQEYEECMLKAEAVVKAVSNE